MFGILGIALALFIFGTSAIANLYGAGKFANGHVEIKKGNSARNVAITAFLLDAVAFFLLLPL